MRRRAGRHGASVLRTVGNVPTSRRWSLRSTWRMLLKELGAFGVVGAVSFVVDVSLFQLLITQTQIDAVTSKLIAALVATTTGFLGHRFWSFAHRSHTQLHRDYGRFVLVNAVTLLLSLGIVAFVRYPLGQEGALALQAANVTAIAVGTVIRFVVYRSWVFPPRAEERPASAPAI